MHKVSGTMDTWVIVCVCIIQDHSVIVAFGVCAASLDKAGMWIGAAGLWKPIKTSEYVFHKR
jgi:hypothetical protein